MSSEFLATTSQYMARLKSVRNDEIALKTFISNSRKLSRQKFRNYLACEFTARHQCRNAGMNLKSTTRKGLNFQMIDSLMASWGMG